MNPWKWLSSLVSNKTVINKASYGEFHETPCNYNDQSEALLESPVESNSGRSQSLPITLIRWLNSPSHSHAVFFNTPLFSVISLIFGIILFVVYLNINFKWQISTFYFGPLETHVTSQKDSRFSKIDLIIGFPVPKLIQMPNFSL